MTVRAIDENVVKSPTMTAATRTNTMISMAVSTGSDGNPLSSANGPGAGS